MSARVEARYYNSIGILNVKISEMSPLFEKQLKLIKGILCDYNKKYFISAKMEI